MVERTQLGQTILRHWRENCPQMVRELEKAHRLKQTLDEAQERTGDLLYELVSVKKMDYQAAWEMAMQEWAFPQEKTGRRQPYRPKKSTQSRSRNRHRRGTSA